MYERKLKSRVYIAVALGTWGCRDGGAIATPAPTIIAAPPSTVSSGSPPSTGGRPTVAEAEPPSLQLELKSEATNDPSVWSLVAAGVDPPLHHLITSFRLPAICGLVEGGAQRANVTCPDGTTVMLSLDDGLQIGDERVSLARPVKISLPTRVEQPPTPVCETETATVVDVRLRRKPLIEDGERRYSMVMEVGRQSFEVLSLDSTPMTCHTSLVFPKTTSLTGGCAFNESSSNFSITFSEGALWVETGWDGYDGRGVDRRYGVKLPCAAIPRFHELRLRDPAWRPFGSRCGDVCLTQAARCEEGCYRRLADDFGSLSAAGATCVSRCSDATNNCTAACQRKGQYP